MTLKVSAVLPILFLAAVTDVRGQTAAASPQPPAAPAQGSSVGQQERLGPGMAAYTSEVLFGDVWLRPQLSPRDRSLVTISVLIATGRTAQLQGHLTRALNNGVLPVEASGVLTHLALYCGWPSAVSALDAYDQVYTARTIDTAPFRALGPPAPAPDDARTRSATEALETVAPKFTQLTNDVVFGDLWRRSDLSLRDRSLVTIAALAAMGDDDQLGVYLRLGLDNGLTRLEIAEAFTHLAFYAGWPKATKALVAAAPLLAEGAAALPELSIERAGSRPVVSAGHQNFSGQARVESLFEAQAPSRMSGSSVTFEAGARTAWHTHPLGQVLMVTAGRGRVQQWDGPIVDIHPGDVVRIPPNVKHWHGAGESDSMTHIALAEHLDGTRVIWMERVADSAVR